MVGKVASTKSVWVFIIQYISSQITIPCLYYSTEPRKVNVQDASVLIKLSVNRTYQLICKMICDHDTFEERRRCEQAQVIEGEYILSCLKSFSYEYVY